MCGDLALQPGRRYRSGLGDAMLAALGDAMLAAMAFVCSAAPASSCRAPRFGAICVDSDMVEQG